MVKKHNISNKEAISAMSNVGFNYGTVVCAGLLLSILPIFNFVLIIRSIFSSVDEVLGPIVNTLFAKAEKFYLEVKKDDRKENNNGA